jgi:hypothetical protein
VKRVEVITVQNEMTGPEKVQTQVGLNKNGDTVNRFLSK